MAKRDINSEGERNVLLSLLNVDFQIEDHNEELDEIL